MYLRLNAQLVLSCLPAKIPYSLKEIFSRCGAAALGCRRSGLADRMSPVIVPIPCPSGKHSSSILSYRDFNMAALFCWPCEVAWTVSPFHPEIQHIPTEIMPYGCHPLRES